MPDDERLKALLTEEAAKLGYDMWDMDGMSQPLAVAIALAAMRRAYELDR